MTPHLGKKGRRYYLSDVPLERAVRDFESALRETGGLAPTRSERLPLEQALGRITSEPVWARVSSPHYDSAAMDGVAVRAADTVGATETSPVRLRPAPKRPGWTRETLSRTASTRSSWFEVIHEVDDETIEIRDPVPPYHHVRPLERISSRPSSCFHRGAGSAPPTSEPARPRASPRSTSAGDRGSPSSRPAPSSYPQGAI